MLDSIPTMREQVRTAVTREMREWLFEVREKGRLVGQLALEGMEARQRRWKVKSGKDAMLSLAKVNSPIELVVNERIECECKEECRLSIGRKLESDSRSLF